MKKVEIIQILNFLTKRDRPRPASNGIIFSRRRKNKGILLAQVLVFAAIAILLISALIGWAGINIKASRQAFFREQALQIAEAGVEYYRWHLAHAGTDFEDGTGAPGPYVHNFLDKDGTIIGAYSLDIIPPPVGSTIVTIRSKGTVNAYPSIYRRVEARLAIPSWAKFAVVANADMRFGVGTEVFGPIHSNGGIRFDGLAHNIVSSNRSNYNDADHTGNNEFGVHTHSNPPPTTPPPPNAPSNSNFIANEAPPTTPIPARTDTFLAGRQFPVPAVDFAGLTTDLAAIKTEAQTNGFYRAGSGALGYHVVLINNDTFSLYRVNILQAPPGSCTNPGGQIGWGTWSIGTSGGAQTLLGTYAMPANGLIFLEDARVWVDGQINTARVTIAASRFNPDPALQSQITVNSNLLYTNYNGEDTIALMAEFNINVGLFSADDLRIDAALVAQQGRAGRYYYSSYCAPNNVRNSLTLFGMVATAQRYGFSYTGSPIIACAANPTRSSGYCTRNLIYDANLLYSPPPSFPLTSDQYSILSWQEIK